MKQLVSLFFFILLLNLILGCSPKEIIYFTQGTGGFENSKRKPVNHLEANFSERKQKPTRPFPDSVVFTAAAQPILPQTTLQLPENLSVMQAAGIEYFQPKGTPPNNQLTAKEPYSKISFRKSFKKLNQPQSKPIHKLATISLGLGLASILFLFLAVIFTGIAGVLSTLILLNTIGGLVTSRIALKQIRENPDKYSGKGRARAGFIISLVMGALLVLLLIIGIIFLVLFFGNFS